MMRIYLTGFMGSGKSTVGRVLAQYLECEFLDLDTEIEKRTGRTIPEIFAESENQFRKAETACLQSITRENAVIATGGGCFIHNQQWMLENGKVIYLYVPFEILAERIGADPNRPLWRNAETLYREREVLYRTAPLTVDGTASPEAVAAAIKHRL